MQGEGRVIRRLRHGAQSEKPNIKIEHKSRTGPYIATVEGIDVYGVSFEPRIAWLFSSQILRAVTYAALDESSRCVEITFEPTDENTGALRFRFIQSAEWMEYPIFEIQIGGSVA
jgi:hypothetical protein